MIEIKARDRTTPALSRGELARSFNRATPALDRRSLGGINRKSADYREAGPEPARGAQPAPPSRPAPAVAPMTFPRLLCPVRKGQKTALGLEAGNIRHLRLGFGWNVKDDRLDIDASAFLLGEDGRVPGDDWFVFYGQPVSPDGSVRFVPDAREDRQAIALDLTRLRPDIQRVTLVMTINEALQRRLNFGMIQAAYLRVLDGDTGRELASFAPQEYYDNVTSMTMGELYLHRGEWKFNPVGNGVGLDLAGQCALYGVEIC